MTLPNHALAGAVIGTIINQPVLALSLAFVSHFVLDAFPHWGYKAGGYENALKQKYVKPLVVYNFALLIFVMGLLSARPAIVLASAFIALVPDLFNLLRYFFLERGNANYKPDAFTRFHRKIQWCERPWGLIVEALAFIILLIVVLKLLS